MQSRDEIVSRDKLKCVAGMKVVSRHAADLGKFRSPPRPGLYGRAPVQLP